MSSMLESVAPSSWSWQRPEALAPVRVLFIGPKVYERSALSKSAWAVTSFVDSASEAAREHLRPAILKFQPHVVICFRPELLPKGVLEGIPSLTVGFMTEPAAHTAQDKRDAPLFDLDVASFDRLIHFDVRSLDELRSKGYPVWRSLPVPIDWQAYESHTPLRQRTGVVFVGRASAAHERFLHAVKRNFDLRYVEEDVSAPDLRELLGRCAIGIDLLEEDGSRREHRIPLYFACGNLVLTQDSHPVCGLENEEDHVRFRTPEELHALVHGVLREPVLYEGIRQLAIAKRALFDSEQVYRKLVQDLYFDVEVYGRGARATPVCNNSS